MRRQRSPEGAWKAWVLEILQSGGAGECWDWPFYTVSNNYGQCRWEGRDQQATHVVWEMKHGEKPPVGLHACHTCDRPICVNPAHIFFGTRHHNMSDASSKGRISRGSHRPQAKLSEDEIVAIRLSCEKQATLAQRYGVNQSTISRIKRGTLWRYLQMTEVTTA